ncbi:putative aspartic peptidase A1 family [Rosa chinensis]|uniref:Putative aspartic peptidase A1 family n=1 Tax=Rosa chinensis TaxID=74649 RepID=A0A2P6R9S8_ROSCH|nr:putative aspartic peptidase A1 family [Rosa chinensis]
MAKNDASLGLVGEFLKRCQQSGEPSTRRLQRSEPNANMRLYHDVLTNGYYTTRLWIGTPPQMFALIMDTGSGE